MVYYMKPEQKLIKDQVIQMKQRGLCNKEINLITGIPVNRIGIWTRHLNLPYNHPLSKTNFIVHDYFSTKNMKKHPERFVVVGFIAADGCISTKDNTLCFNLCVKDKCIIDLLNNILSNDTRTVTYIKSTNSCGITFPSKQIAKDLSKYGIVPRKTSTFELPNLDYLQMSYFIRGYLYGDGCCFNYGGNQFGYSFICTSSMAVALRKYLIANKIMSHCIVSILKRNPIYSQVRFAGIRAIELSRYIFNNDDMILLPRKHIKYHLVRNDFTQNL